MLTSQLIDEDFLQGQGQGFQHKGLELSHPLRHGGGGAPDDVGVYPSYIGEILVLSIKALI